MSIASEITRLQGVKADILTAIGDKGVTVPAGSALDDCPGLIASIPTGTSSPDGYVLRTAIWSTLNGLDFFNFVDYDSSENLSITLEFQSKSAPSTVNNILGLRGKDGNTIVIFGANSDNPQSIFCKNDRYGDGVTNTCSFNGSYLRKITATLKENTLEVSDGITKDTFTNINFVNWTIGRMFMAVANFYIYRLTLDNGSKKYDFVPVQRASDNTWGLYDLVSQTFKTAQYPEYLTGI